MKKNCIVSAIVFLVFSVQAKMITKEYDYKIDTTTFKGFVAYDDAVKGKRPGVLVAHDWWGLSEFAKTEAKRLAQLGYVAFAVDMYGNGQSTTDFATAAKLAGAVRGTPRMRSRIVAGFDALLRQENVDPQRVAAIGFCFGGTGVLELAYSGADVKGVVSFHGGLFSLKPEEAAHVKAKFLILHGADDPTMPADTISQFQESLRKAGVDWQMAYYGNAVHGFCNPASGSDKSKGVAYDSLAQRRSWQYMQNFLQEILAGK
ncbi:MAG: dienelactone hydrolase family protein [Chitinivibrionales bacterium]|nr:dienelactone hydrolase family protein [Chitinivibrionales bacterium]